MVIVIPYCASMPRLLRSEGYGMRLCSYLLAMIVALLIVVPVWAQEQPKAWLGTTVQDLSKDEADKLGWDVPHGAKVMAAASGSPAEQAGLKPGDLILPIDRVEVDTASDFEAAIAAKQPAAEVRLSVLSGGRERRIATILRERPKSASTEVVTPLQLMLDTGGHMAKINGIAITPDGKQI